MTPQESIQKGLENIKMYIDNKVAQVDSQGVSDLLGSVFNISINIFGNNLQSQGDSEGGNGGDTTQPEGAF
jgi:hypothetical protein